MPSESFVPLIAKLIRRKKSDQEENDIKYRMKKTSLESEMENEKRKRGTEEKNEEMFKIRFLCIG